MDSSTSRRSKIVENDHQKYSQASQSQKLKQTESINTMRKENEVLKQNLASVSGGSFRFGEQEKLQELQNELDSIDRLCEFEQTTQAENDSKYQKLRTDCLNARRSMKNVNYTADNTLIIEKQIRVLENRLEQAWVQFNQALSQNKDLRQQIDNLRGERKTFNEIYRKLETELHAKKVQMAAEIEEANSNYEESKHLSDVLLLLQKDAEKDAEQYEEKFRSLEESMARVKAQVQQQQQQQLLQEQQKSVNNKNKSNRSDAPGASSNGKTKGLNSSEGRMSDSNVNQSPRSDEEVLTEEMMNDLKRDTVKKSMKELEDFFVDAEEHNFSAFNYINALNSQREQLEEDIAALTAQQEAESGDAHRRKQLKELEEELARTEEQCDKLDADTKSKSEKLLSLCKSAETTFNKCGCSKELARSLLGTTECNLLNIVDFIGIIEHRVTELLFKQKIRTLAEQRGEHDEESETGDESRVPVQFVGVEPAHAKPWHQQGQGSKDKRAQEESVSKEVRDEVNKFFESADVPPDINFSEDTQMSLQDLKNLKMNTRSKATTNKR